MLPIEMDSQELAHDGPQWRQVLEHLAKMQIQGVADVSTYSAAMRACCMVAQWRQTLKLLAEMQTQGLEPDESCWKAAILACMNERCIEEYNMLLMVCKVAGWGARAAALIDEPPLDVCPNVISYSTAMSACLSQAPYTVLSLLHCMMSKNMDPDITAWKTALQACKGLAPSTSWEQALQLLREMQERHVKPDVDSYRMAIQTCEESAQWQIALQLLDDMRAKGVWPDRATYKAAVSTCERGGQWYKARVLRLKMEMLPCTVGCDCILCEPSLYAPLEWLP